MVAPNYTMLRSRLASKVGSAKADDRGNETLGIGSLSSRGALRDSMIRDRRGQWAREGLSDGKDK
jgi:hypothetical protein